MATDFHVQIALASGQKSKSYTTELVDKLATNLSQTHLVDKLLEQQSHNLLTSLLHVNQLRKNLVDNLLKTLLQAC
jgi:hypothetical protein